MLFIDSWGRHQTCSSVSWPRQCSIFATELVRHVVVSVGRNQSSSRPRYWMRAVYAATFQLKVWSGSR